MVIFLDSDVIISSLLSSSGAAYLLLQEENVIRFISSISKKEIAIVCGRLQIPNEKFEKLSKNNLEIIEMKTSVEDIQKEYGNYVLDANDAHIVAGAISAKAQFLISYNLKDFRIEKIRSELKINVLTPGLFLQYLRSRV